MTELSLSKELFDELNRLHPEQLNSVITEAITNTIIENLKSQELYRMFT